MPDAAPGASLPISFLNSRHGVNRQPITFALPKGNKMTTVNTTPLRKSLPVPRTNLQASIPADLRSLHQWVAWKLTPEGKKIPVNPLTGCNASTTDPTTWGTHEEAANAVSSNNLSGVGFVFTQGDPYVGVDLDKCRDAATGKLEAWAQEIVDSLASYTEVSPSGTGVHILVKGTWTPGANRKGQVEVYGQERFFTVTGKVVGQNRTIEERTQGLADLRRKHFGGQSAIREALRPKAPAFTNPKLTDEEVLEQARRSPKADKFDSLWAGVWDGLFQSQSEGDLALANMLAEFTGDDREQVDRLFRASGLYRPKWDEKRGAATYGEKVLDKALGVLPHTEPTAPPSSFHNAVVTFGQLESMELPEQRFLLEPWLLESSLNLLSAEAGTGKTFFALEVAAACVDGRDAMGGRWKCPRRSNVLIVDGEMLPSAIRERGRMLGLDRRCRLISKVLFEKANPNLTLNLADDAVQNMIMAYCQKLKINLLILDNIYSLFYRLDSNSDKDWQPMNAWLLRLKAAGVAVLIIHHTNKKGEQLGTSSRVFNLDSHLVLKKPKARRPHAAFSIEIQKSRHQLQGIDGPLYEFIDGQWVVSDGKPVDDNATMKKKEVAQKLVAGVAQKQIAAGLGCSTPYISQIKQSLVRKGLLKKVKDGKLTTYALTESGEEWIAPGEE